MPSSLFKGIVIGGKWWTNSNSPFSLAGGTGSGLGSLLSEVVHERFRKAARLSIVVAAGDTGDVAVQSYNACLSLSHLVESSDAIVVLENNYYIKVAKKYHKMERPTLHDLNSLIVKDLVTLFLPCHRITEKGSSSSSVIYDRSG